MTLQDPITLLVTGGTPEASLGLCCFLQSLGGPLAAISCERITLKDVGAALT